MINRKYFGRSIFLIAPLVLLAVTEIYFSAIDQGHASEILSVSWCLQHDWLFATASMDESMMIWSIKHVRSRSPLTGC